MAKDLTWINFWDNETTMSQKLIQKSMTIFLDGFKQWGEFTADDVVLDLGCGPGLLADAISDRVKEVHCADVSSKYLSICSNKFRNKDNVFVHRIDPANYTSLDYLKNKRITKVICLSVVSYYQSKEDIRRLVENIKKIADRGCLIVISDLPSKGSLVKDILGNFKVAFRYNHTFELLRFLVRTITTNYRRFRTNNSLLEFDDGELELLARELPGKVMLTDQLLGTNANRRHLIIEL